MKKILVIIVTLVMLLSIMPFGAITAFAQEVATSGTTGDCTWTLDGTVLTISGSGKMENYDASYYYEKAPWGEKITEVIIEEGVTNIGEDAFYKCFDLKSITIPSTVTHIDYAFYSCDAIESLYISDMVAWCNIDFETSPLNYSYHGGNLYLNGELVENLEIPECITRLPAYVFDGCASLKTVTIHDKLTSIGDEAFAGCLNLKSVTLSEGLTTIGYRAFYNCNGFETIKLPDSLTTIGVEAFSACYDLITVTIPEKVTSIGAKAFASCPSLTRVNLPKSLNNIGGYIFRDSPYAYGCCYKNSFAGEYLKSNNYEAVYIDDTVENVICSGKVGKFNWSLDKRTGVLKISGDGRLIDFKNVEAPWIKYSNYITCVEFEGNITYISERAFITCYAIYEIDIPDSVTEIGKFAFYSCKGIRKIIIPEGVVTIGSSAFYYCENLESVYLPTTLKTINDSAFNYCYKLEAVYVPDIYTWFNIQFNKKTGYVTNPLDYAGNLYINGELVENLVIPEGVTNVPESAFFCCTSLKSLVIPDSVTTIKNCAFQMCSNLKEVTFGNGLKSINNGAFSGCVNLTNITIPYNVTTINKSAFNNCNNLVDVMIFNKDCYINAESGLNYNQNIYGYFGSTVEKYAEEIGANFLDITEIHKEHDYKLATCTNPNLCVICGTLQGNALGHTYDNDCDASCNVCNQEREIVNHTYRSEVDKICDICGAEREITGQHLIEEDGATYYYVDGEKSDITSLVKINGKWHYIKDGKFASKETTLVKYNGKWYYVKNGLKNTATTLVKYNGKWYYVEKGVKSTKTTLVNYNGTWYYVKDGKKNTSTTLVKYNGTWYYVKSGKKSTDTTLCKYGGKYYYVKSGKKNSATTIVKYNGKKYYVKKGIAQTSFSGKVKINGKKYTVKKGIIK